MQILEYDDIDPLDALHLSMLGLDYALTPEQAAHLRRSDPRLFPCLTIYGVEGKMAVGQVGISRLPMVSVAGREDVGGIWAVCTHPECTGHGVASHLLEEAHSRMRDAGLRFSTLSTNRCLTTYKLYQQLGYVDMGVWATALAPWETAHRPTRLRARPPGAEGYQFIEQLFAKIAGDYLGFTWRHTPFGRLHDKVNLDEIWIIWRNERPVGFAVVRKNTALLNIHDLMLQNGLDIIEAVAALAAEVKSEFVQIMISRPTDIVDLRRAGWRVTHPSWNSFMVKPLMGGVSVDIARQLFGIGTDRFLISWLDKF
jgi:GNAT superfamily N-acetyltransferase